MRNLSPAFFLSEVRFAPLANYLTAVTFLTSFLALVLLWIRGRSVLDLWVTVAIAATLIEQGITAFLISNRFSLGFYVGASFSVIVSTIVLMALLSEIVAIYTKLSHANKELQREQESKQLLIDELNHRVKNILAQMSAVAASTRQGSSSIDKFLGSLNGRIQCMAVAHNLLSETGWQSVGLDALASKLLAPYATRTNVTISGPDVVLDAAETQAVAKVLHELATNAVKYGALSITGGHVSVNWDLKPNGAVTDLTLLWRELGGPSVTSERPSSYGTDLVRNLIPHELGGTVNLVFAKEGVNCRIEVPVRQP